MIESSLVLDIELENIYRQKILKMLETFVSLMHCSHLSIKPTQFMLGEKANLKKLLTTKEKQPTKLC